MDNEKVIEYLKTVAYLGRSKIEGDEAMCWYSKTDGSYICREEFRDKALVHLICDNALTELQSHDEPGSVVSIGFDAAGQRWFGWSHRAVMAFCIGSEVQKGDCAYVAPGKDEFLEKMRDFWNDPDHEVTMAKHSEKAGEGGVLVEWIYSQDVPNETLRGQKSSAFAPYPKEFGRGEWKAETLEDAKRMACDFAESVG